MFSIVYFQFINHQQLVLFLPRMELKNKFVTVVLLAKDEDEDDEYKDKDDSARPWLLLLCLIG